MTEQGWQFVLVFVGFTVGVCAHAGFIMAVMKHRGLTGR